MDKIEERKIEKPAEIERLEIIEKKIEIQKRRIDLSRHKLNLSEIYNDRNIRMEEHRLIIDKITELRQILTDTMVDDERTTIGGEPFLKPILDNEERVIITNKIFELVKKL